MFVEKPEELKSWMASLLSRMCDADPEALAKYILALVRKDKSAQQLKTFLLEQLEIFLLQETRTFVELLFDALQKKSYFDTGSEIGLLPMATNSISKSNLDGEASLQEENRPSSPVKLKLTNDNTENPQRNRENPNSQKRRNEDKDSSSKRITTTKEDEKTNTAKENKSEENSKKSYAGSRSNSAENVNSGSNSTSKPKCVYSTTEQSTSSNREHPQTVVHSDPSHGDTDYRQIGDLNAKKMQNKNKVPYSTKQSTRCKDYDERGYCLKGDFCDFDHGNDPILVENVSSLNFGVNLSTDRMEEVSVKPPLPPLPPSPPSLPAPPLPPLPPSPTGSFVPEPYNPESPGMNAVLPPHRRNTHLNFYLSTVSQISHLPSSSPHPPPFVSSTTSCDINSSIWGNAEPSYHHKPRQRTRELIGVTTVDSSSMNYDTKQNKDSNNGYHKPINGHDCSSTRVQSARSSDFKKRGFDFSRLGAATHRKCLEIRRIPKLLNTITNLLNHFAKFGNVVNIEVGYAGDPEAAKVSFSTHGEATTAYRSTEPILNNRFIKVFWNNDSEKSISSNFSKEIHVKDSLLNPEVNKGTSLNCASQESIKDGVNLLGKVIEKSVSKRKMPSSVYVSNNQLSLKKGTSLSHKTTRKGSEKETSTAHKKMKFEIHQAKSELMKSQIAHQKIILDQLIKAKNKKEKDFLKKTSDKISEKIKEMQNDLKKDNEELKCLLKPTPQDALKSATKKELLDAELDLYNKQHAGDEDTSELAQKVSEMKNKAKALGLVESTSHSPKYAFKKRGKSSYHPTCTFSSLSVDHRPRKILVLGSSDKDGLQKHFRQFGNIATVDEISGGIVFTFSSRMEAEAAYAYGTKFGDELLTLSWFNESHSTAVPHSNVNEEELELKAIDTQLVEVDDDDDDEEDSEARSWRR